MSKQAGVDAQGYVLTLGDVAMQPEFQPLLADACASLSQSGLDGIYVYGSVARGEANPAESDLDLTLVLIDPPGPQVLANLETLRQTLEQRHSVVSKIDFDIGHRAEVLAPQNQSKWGFWLKHHCRCVWGNDLSLRFERFKPSREIALALNGDFEPVLNGYLTRIRQPGAAPMRLRLQREAARKLIRATNTLRAPHADAWPHTLEEHVALFIQSYPAMRVQIAYFLFEARNPSAEGEAFDTRLQAFIAWMVSLRT